MHMVVDEQQLSLAAWYAQPLDAKAAQGLLREVHGIQQQAHRARTACSACPFHEMVARYWLGRSIEGAYEHLMHSGNAGRRRALAELISGQLLMSRRVRGAMERLRNGFYLAGPYLAAADYFQVLKRHELLAVLPLLPQPAPAQSLDALLREARVILQLQGPARRPPGDRGDLIG